MCKETSRPRNIRLDGPGSRQWRPVSSRFGRDDADVKHESRRAVLGHRSAVAKSAVEKRDEFGRRGRSSPGPATDMGNLARRGHGAAERGRTRDTERASAWRLGGLRSSVPRSLAFVFALHSAKALGGSSLTERTGPRARAPRADDRAALFASTIAGRRRSPPPMSISRGFRPPNVPGLSCKIRAQRGFCRLQTGVMRSRATVADYCLALRRGTLLAIRPPAEAPIACSAWG